MASAMARLATGVAALALLAHVAMAAPLRNATYADRVAWYLDISAQQGGRDIWADLARLKVGYGSVSTAYQDALNRLTNRIDGSDFYLPPLARMIFEYGDSPQLPADVREQIREALLAFQYWIDEGGEHGNLQYWSENHAVLYHASEYVIGSLLADEVFSNSGMTGAEHATKGRALLSRWLDLRSRLGFNEYCSEVYSTFVISALLLVVDLGPDPEIATRAAMVLDLLLLDLSLNSFRGMVTSFRGRTYESNKFSPESQSSSPAIWLLTGQGATNPASRGATPLAISRKYVPSAALLALSEDRRSTWSATSRVGIDTREGPQYGLGYTDPADGIVWFGMGAYATPDTVELFLNIVPNAYDLWEHEIWEPLQPLIPLGGTGVFERVSELVSPISTGSILGPVSMSVYRTASAALGTAVEYRPSSSGFQQHSWQATLGDGIPVFATHPGPNPSDYALSLWTGAASMPRASMYESVLVALHQPPWLTPLSAVYPNRTHAYFPRSQFDDVVERNGWILGRADDSFVALYSAVPTVWTTTGEYAGRELVANGDAQNVWIAEIGSVETDGSFDSFVARITGGTVNASWTPPFLAGGGDGMFGCIVRNDCLDPADPVGSLTDCFVKIPIVNPNPPCAEYLDLAGLATCLGGCADGDRICQGRCVSAAVVLDPPTTVPGDMDVVYTDAAGRTVTYSWDAPLTVTFPGRAPVQVVPEQFRYRNPFVTAPWGARTFNITAGGRSLLLDFDAGVRQEV